MNISRTYVLAGFLIAALGVSPSISTAQSGEDVPDLRQFGDIRIQERHAVLGGWGREAPEALGFPDGEKLDSPVSVRAWRYRDSDGLPMCYTLAESSTFNTVFDETFTPDSGTEYVWVTLIGQITVPSGSGPFAGVLFRCTVEQDIGGTVYTQFCPGAGEDGEPFLGRRDNDAVGQQQYGTYQGVVTGIDPSYDVRVKIDMRSNDGTSYACFVNLIVQAD
jgi:hypothetical protein